LSKNAISYDFKKENIKERIKPFIFECFKVQSLNSNQAWNLDNEDCFSEWLKREIQRIKPIIMEFIKEGYSKKISKKYNMKHFFLHRLSYGIAEDEDIIKSLFHANGWKGKLGLELAIAKLKIFEKENGRLPVYEDKGMKGLINAINRGEWREFNINSWNDLFKKTFGKKNKFHNKYKGKSGLEIAIKELRAFEKKKNKVYSNDKGMKGIISAISRGEWSQYGINLWNDLLGKAFGKINRIQNKYIGKKGLNIAIQELIDFKNENGRLPRSYDKEVRGITGATYRGEWFQFCINSWNDLLRKAFGKINFFQNKYVGKKGLEIAKNVLIEFKNKNSRIPISTDKGMRGIIAGIYRGEWCEFGIKKWSDLKMFVFNKLSFQNFLDFNKF
jgi:hypothetical protein